MDRVREHKERPDALEALNNMVNISMGFLEKSKSLPEDEQLFTEVELSTLEKLVTETVTWREKKVKEQDATPFSSPPVLTVRSIAEKIDALDREVKYMVNKARVNKLNKMKDEAKKKEAENKTDEEKEKNNNTEGENQRNADSERSEAEPTQEGTPDVFEDSRKGSSTNESTEEVKPSKTEAEDTHTEL